MTTASNRVSGAAETQEFLVFPDPPEIPEDKMTNFDHLASTGNVHHLIQHLGSPETTLVAGERYLAVAPTRNLAGIRYPDLLVAFDVDPAAYRRRRAYVISEQAKPPDFVLEVASPSTGRIDATDKRNDYAALGIPEYWRFDETGRSHGARLAGDRLMDGQYQSVEIEELAHDVLQGYSAALNLNIRWERGQLQWFDPATGQRVLTYDDQRERANREREARLRADARIRELEEQLRRLSS